MTRTALVVAMIVAGCSSDRGTCAVSGGGMLALCIDYGSEIPEPDARRSCEGQGNTWQDSGCDSTGAVARCDLFGSSTTYYETFLTTSGMTVDQLRASCTQTGGEFSEL